MKTFRETFIVLLGLAAPWLILGGVLGIFPAWKAYRYVWSNPRFCSSCHVHDYANSTWQSNVHGKFTTCQDCHHQPLTHYTKWSYSAMTAQPSFPQDLKHLPNIPRDLCESCHTRAGQEGFFTGPFAGKNIRQMPKVEELYLHSIHMRMKTRNPLPSESNLASVTDPGSATQPPAERLKEARDLSCMDCHGGEANRGHDVSVADRACLRCHATSHSTTFIRKYGCKACHYQDFLTPLDAVMLKGQQKLEF